MGGAAVTSLAMSLAGYPLAQLTDIFHQHLLQHLPASSLARLRASCLTVRCLVDSGEPFSAAKFPHLTSYWDAPSLLHTPGLAGPWAWSYAHNQ